MATFFPGTRGVLSEMIAERRRRTTPEYQTAVEQLSQMRADYARKTALVSALSEARGADEVATLLKNFGMPQTYLERQYEKEMRSAALDELAEGNFDAANIILGKKITPAVPPVRPEPPLAERRFKQEKELLEARQAGQRRYASIIAGGKRVPTTLEEEAQDYILKGFPTENVEAWYQDAKETGVRKPSLLGEMPMKAPPRQMVGQIQRLEAMIDSRIESEWDDIPKEFKTGGKGLLGLGSIDAEERKATREKLLTLTDDELNKLSPELQADVRELRDWSTQRAISDMPPSVTVTDMDDRIQEFMRKNDITDRDTALQILKDAGIMQ